MNVSHLMCQLCLMKFLQHVFVVVVQPLQFSLQLTDLILQTTDLLPQVLVLTPREIQLLSQSGDLAVCL